MRLRMDCKAAVSIGEHCHGGKTRGGDKANDLDMGCKEKYIPFGVVKEDSADPYLTFGSSAKTSDFIVDCLYAWWESQPSEERDAFSLLKIKADNRPESNGRRTQFLNRAADFADYIGKPVQLQYYPPCHSKYNPVDRCWGILGKHLNGKRLADVQTVLEWANSIVWKGIHPICGIDSQGLRKRYLPLLKRPCWR